MPRNLASIVLAAIVAMLTAVVVIWLAPRSWFASSTASSTSAPATPPGASHQPVVPSASRVVALGTLKPAGGVIDVGGTTGDRLKEVLIKAGDTVKKGDPLARLESYDLRETQVQIAEQALKDATARQKLETDYGQSLVDQAMLGVENAKLQQAEIAVQQTKIDALEKAVVFAKKQLERMTGLDDSIIAPALRERQQLAVQQAEAELAGARAALDRYGPAGDLAVRQAEAKLNEAKIGKDRLSGALQMDQLQRNVDLAKEQLEMSVIRAPKDGRVLDVVMKPGETVAQRPILRMGDTAHMYAMAEVYETDVARVRPGQDAEVTSPALADTLKGKVEYVATSVAKNEVISIDPTKSADLRVVEVRIALDDSSSQEAARLVNLQVSVAIDVGDRRASIVAPPLR